MGNTLTGLIQYVYDSVDVVSRELVGMIPAVYSNSAADQVAKDQNISYDIVPAATVYDVTPSNALPALDSTTVAAGTMSISKVRGVKFHWTGEDEKAVGRTAKAGIQNNKFAQAFRALTGEMEADLAALYTYASRAYGTAGSAPFGTAGDFTAASNVVKILKDNGAPLGALQLVINTAAGANILGKQTQAQMVGSSDPLLRGVLLDINGCKIRESAAIKAHTKGAGTGYDFVTAGEALGQTTLSVEGGTVNVTGIKAGDVITHAGDTVNKYIVSTGSTATSGDIVINNPGLLIAGADANEITIGDSYAANMAFARDAIHLLTRLPLMPEGGDAADDIMIVQDPVSGIYFQVAMYRAYRAVLFEVAVAWGVKAAKSEHMAILLG
ncbi:MAG: P22 coat - protein 5 family protein [Limnohabitans sp.]